MLAILLFLVWCVLFKQWNLKYVKKVLFLDLEYCVDEVFNPQCENGNLILMHSAMYGRMNTGKCLPTDLGYMGCKADVLAVLDSKCTGQKSCDVVVNDKNIKPRGGCIKGLQSYLEVEYSYVQGLYFPH